MRVFGLLFGLLSLPALALTEVTTQIQDVDHGTKPEDEILVFLTTGQVAKRPKDNKNFLLNFEMSKVKGKWLKLTMDDERFITDFELTEAPVSAVKVFAGREQNMSYVPTTIASMDVAKKYFR